MPLLLKYLVQGEFKLSMSGTNLYAATLSRNYWSNDKLDSIKRVFVYVERSLRVVPEESDLD